MSKTLEKPALRQLPGQYVEEPGHTNGEVLVSVYFSCAIVGGACMVDEDCPLPKDDDCSTPPDDRSYCEEQDIGYISDCPAFIADPRRAECLNNVCRILTYEIDEPCDCYTGCDRNEDHDLLTCVQASGTSSNSTCQVQK